MSKKIEVHVEWPNGSKTVEFEVDDDLSPESIEECAKQAFYDTCNFGYTVDGVDP